MEGIADPSGAMPDDGQLVACFDVAPDGKHATLVAAKLSGDGLVRLRVVAAWKTSEAAHAELSGVLEKLKPAAIAWYPNGPGGAFAPMLRPAKPRVPLPAGTRPKLAGGIESVELTGGKVAEVCQGLADMAKGRKVVHPSDPLLDAHIAGAQKLNAADGWRFARRGAGHVDAAYAGAGAAYVALTLPRWPDRESGLPHDQEDRRHRTPHGRRFGLAGCSRSRVPVRGRLDLRPDRRPRSSRRVIPAARVEG